MSLPDILYHGSVKDVRGAEGRSPYIFEYSDRYSVFDWGEMPDKLEGKGRSLAFMAWLFFELLGDSESWRQWRPPAALADDPCLIALRERGARHHGLGMVDDRGGPLDPRQSGTKLSTLYAVRPVRVMRPEAARRGGRLAWDYAAYRTSPIDALVPLEVIFRFGVPEGSSLLKRADDQQYCRSIGLQEKPGPGDCFDHPIIEFSTKLENHDRYLNYEQAADIAALSPRELSHLRSLTTLLALRLRDIFADCGVELWDGKFEFAFCAGTLGESARQFMLVDSIGPDELRLVADGVHLSKECLRHFYRGGHWHLAVEKAKHLAEERGVEDWKKICIDELKTTPSPLTPALARAASMIYQSLAGALARNTIGLERFEHAWTLEETVGVLKSGVADRQEATAG